MKNIKQYKKEIIILLIQLFMFYIYPLFIGETEVILMVFMIWLSTIILSALLTIISNKRIKYLYPIILSILFLPSVFIYYNSSALVHSLWYLASSSIGIIIGIIINLISKKLFKKSSIS